MKVKNTKTGKEGIKMSDDIKIEDILSDEFKEFCHEIGLNKGIQLTKRYGGEYVYIPKYASISRASRDRKIKELFDGSNIKQLARRFDLSSKTIRHVLFYNTQ